MVKESQLKYLKTIRGSYLMITESQLKYLKTLMSKPYPLLDSDGEQIVHNYLLSKKVKLDGLSKQDASLLISLLKSANKYSEVVTTNE